ncbi:MAG: hypothetical protein ABSG62_21970 [Terracidiphilus sp.]|jgi:hypothetical protein
MAEFPSSFRIRGTAVFEVGPPGFDAIVEALPLDIAELLRRRIPAAAIMVWTILTVSLLRAVLGRAVLGRAVLADEQNGYCQGKSKRWKSKSNELHW